MAMVKMREEGCGCCWGGGGRGDNGNGEYAGMRVFLCSSAEQRSWNVERGALGTSCPRDLNHTVCGRKRFAIPLYIIVSSYVHV
jgi:hypothetical protein